MIRCNVEMQHNFTFFVNKTFIKLIAGKLHELNSKYLDTKQENIYIISDEKENAIKELMKNCNQVSEEIRTSAINALKNLVDWPNDTVFPVLDIARLAVLQKEVNDQLCTEELLPVIRRHIKSDAFLCNQMLTFRLIANMFQHEKGEKLCLDYKDEILKSLLDLQSLGDRHNQVCHTNY